jgi:hypothetical protein
MLKPSETVVGRGERGYSGGMKQGSFFFFFLFLFVSAMLFWREIPGVYAQNNAALAPGATGRLDALLNSPQMVRPAQAVPLGKNWFRLETDAHVFTNQAGIGQVAAVLLDLEHQDAIYNGKKSRLSATIVQRSDEGVTVDFVSTAIMGIIRIKTPYRALVKTLSRTDANITVEVRQLPSDSDSNNDIKKLYALRYAKEVTIQGKTYTYIRIYTVDEVNASILPGAKGALESNSEPVNRETLRLIIDAARRAAHE